MAHMWWRMVVTVERGLIWAHLATGHVLILTCGIAETLLLWAPR